MSNLKEHINNLDPEKVVLVHLINNPGYFNKTLSKLDKNHFRNLESQIIMENIKDFNAKYETKPSLKELALFILEQSKYDKQVKDRIKSYIKEIHQETPIDNMDFLLDFTKNFIKKMNLQDVILKSVDKLKKDEIDNTIIGNFEEALSIDFDKNLGMIIDEIERKFEEYNEKFGVLPTGINILDETLGGGIRNKSLITLSGASHSGKTAIKCAITAGLTLNKNNGVYFTLEMSEKDIFKRIDANLLNVQINDINKMSFDEYKERYDKIKPYLGKLFVKEYPAGSLDVNMIRSIIDDIESQYNIKLDFIVIDYIGLMNSTRVRMNSGLYTFYKSISEELHGLSKKLDIPVITSTQLNRSAYNNLEAGMENVSDSMGIVMTSDVFINILNDEELRNNSQIMFKFDKNRYTGKLSKIILNADFSKVKIWGEDDEPVSKMNLDIDVSSINISTNNTNSKVEENKNTIENINKNDNTNSKQVKIEKSNSFGIPEVDLDLSQLNVTKDDEFDDFEFD